MAVSGADSARVNRVLTVTLDRYAPKISNELAKNDAVLTVFGLRGALKIVTGGQRAVVTLDVSENLNFAWRDRNSDVPVNKMDVRKEAKYAWATYDGSVALNIIEEAINAGDTRIHNLVEAEITNAQRTITRGIANALRASSPAATEPESVISTIQDNAKASQTGSLGELSRATNTLTNHSVFKIDSDKGKACNGNPYQARRAA